MDDLVDAEPLHAFNLNVWFVLALDPHYLCQCSELEEVVFLRFAGIDIVLSLVFGALPLLAIKQFLSIRAKIG